jgi:site-specific DNA recombinase
LPADNSENLFHRIRHRTKQDHTGVLRAEGRRRQGQTAALLKGLIFGPDGRPMGPTHTRKGGRLYRYYISQSVVKHGPETCSVRRVPAAEIEAAVVDQLRTVLRSPEIVVATWKVTRKEIAELTEGEVGEALRRFDPLWDELFSAEQARVVQLLVERVDVSVDGIDIILHVDGLASLAAEFRTVEAKPLVAA